MGKVKLGFIGCGGIVHGHLDHGLRDFDDVEFVGWCDPNEHAAAARREQVGGRGEIFSDAATMLDSTKPDAVYIMLPPFAHGPSEALVLERKLPFFIEKPVALDLETAQRVAEGVQKHNLITAVGYMNRYRDSVQEVRRRLSEQKPVILHGGWVTGGPDNYEGIWQWWVQKDKSGGQFLEQTIHTTDLASYLFGKIKTVYAVPVVGRRERPDFCTIEDASMVQLTFDSGAAASIYSSCSTAVGVGIWLTVWGTDMRADFSGWEHSAEISLPNGEHVSMKEEPRIYHRGDRAFVDAVKCGQRGDVLATYEDGLESTAVACAANESMISGEVIDLM